MLPTGDTMGDKSKIEWTDATWNPVTGCTKVSQGCKNCYAERLFPRAYGTRKPGRGNGGKSVNQTGRTFTDVRTHPDRLDQPLRWKRPRRVFVNSMSDLFHEDVPDSFIDQVFAVMALAPLHTFQVLTKRPERMLAHCRIRQAAIPQHLEGIPCALSLRRVRRDSVSDQQRQESSLFDS